ncbi:MAG TPA: hypothetical protein VNJ52_05760 [Patescibacteria group bacterium]|nr:hypothetical protein [Patescibacteria group bacterium]
MLGTKQKMPTKELALRALQPYLAKANRASIPVEANHPQPGSTLNANSLVHGRLHGCAGEWQAAERLAATILFPFLNDPISPEPIL